MSEGKREISRKAVAEKSILEHEVVIHVCGVLCFIVSFNGIYFIFLISIATFCSFLCNIYRTVSEYFMNATLKATL